ncbi:MAG: DUF1573 domain-containing protein [Planctomycetota bacterium]
MPDPRAASAPGRGRARRAAVWALLALAASVGPAALARCAGPAEALALELFGVGSSELVFPRAVQDFGTVFTGEVVERAFDFRNEAASPVRIFSVDGTCGCVHAAPSVAYLDPGQTGTVRARFVTDGRYGPQRLRIRVTTDEAERSGVFLTLRGSVRAVLRPRPARLFLRETAPGAHHEAEIDVAVLEPIAAPRLATKGPGLQAAIVAHDADRLTLQTTLDVPARVGTRFGGVTLSYRHRESGRTLETWIPIVWVVPPPLALSPRELRLVEGRAELRVRPRWPGKVSLARVDVGTLPLEVTRTDRADGEIRLQVVNTGQTWEIPADAVLRLEVEPRSLGPVEVPVMVGEP